MTTPVRRMLALSMVSALLAASGGVDLVSPPRRRSDPPPPPPPKAKTPEEAQAELEAHRRWCVEMDAANERRRVEAERVERGRRLERFHGLREHQPPLTEEEIAEVQRTGKSPRPARLLASRPHHEEAAADRARGPSSRTPRIAPVTPAGRTPSPASCHDPR